MAALFGLRGQQLAGKNPRKALAGTTESASPQDIGNMSRSGRQGSGRPQIWVIGGFVGGIIHPQIRKGQKRSASRAYAVFPRYKRRDFSLK
ncbi:hypothetical protein [Paenibacillus sp. YPG26]|uniref:hypothetical protein n=1 Tax=Paenibacillus sp. YPG26 TaxID=2878915 RepID=UPI00203B0F35|nr:hypothetical protein [Paenibacillus sp. YPG26]USB34088.1 hypothetical protein LDO05_04495 [Paenibacillus sp. YPG26]